MLYHSIPVSRPFDVVTRQVLELGEAWLEDAARTATRRGAACGETSPQGANTTVEAHVRVGWPCWGDGVCRLPIEWEVTGNPPWALRGELEVCHVSSEEARLGLKMVVAPALVSKAERSSLQRTVEVAALSFLLRLFWALEALSRYDLPEPGAGRTDDHGRDATGLSSHGTGEVPVAPGRRRRDAGGSGMNSTVARRPR